MNIIGQPDVYGKPLQKWYDKNIKSLIDGTPSVGELRIKWYSAQVQADGSGELVTIEKWDGQYWQQYGLDAHSTVQDLLDLDWKLR